MRQTKGRREGKKNRKHGRNKVKCEAYRREKRREKSHARRIEKHLKTYGYTDARAIEALKRFRASLLYNKSESL